jgi:hypothetical protein
VVDEQTDRQLPSVRFVDVGPRVVGTTAAPLPNTRGNCMSNDHNDSALEDAAERAADKTKDAAGDVKDAAKSAADKADEAAESVIPGDSDNDGN